MKKRILLAYSGGLDTSAILIWLKKTYQADVIAYCCDVGNLPEPAFLEKRARDLGAVDFIFDDASEEFVSDYVYPMLRSGATYFDDYLLGTAIARPLIGMKAAVAAKKLGATHLAHGATGKGNDHIRFERSWAYFAPKLEIIAPWKIWNYKGRTDLANLLRENGHEFGDSVKEYSVDCNLLHRSCEGGILESIEKDYEPSRIQEWVAVKPAPTLAASRKVTLTFDKGVLVALDGKSLTPAQSLIALNELAGAYGIGMADLVEERVNGIKSRGIYETPGGTVIQKALRALKATCFSRELYELSQSNAVAYGKLVYDGLWFSDARLAVESLSKQAATVLNGSIDFTFSWKEARISGRQSLDSLYDERGVSFEQDVESMNHDALGYTRILTASSRRQGERAHK